MKRHAYICLLSVTLFLLLVPSCALVSSARTITVTLAEEFPWERAGGRPVWHLLRWSTASEGIKERFLAPGVRHAVITAEKGALTAAAAYPLGICTPLGALIRLEAAEDQVELRYEWGAAADILLTLNSRSPYAAAPLNPAVFSSALREAGEGDPWRTMRSRLLSDLSRGKLSHSSFVTLPEYHVDLSTLPPGYWISDRPDRAAVSVSSPRLLSGEDFYQGLFRYYLPDQSLCLTVVGGEDSAFWYTKPLRW
jgi:hypothetical protein